MAFDYGASELAASREVSSTSLITTKSCRIIVSQYVNATLTSTAIASSTNRNRDLGSSM